MVMLREQFVQFVEECILSLSQDIKTVVRIVEDPELDDAARIDAAGSILHVLSGSNAIPGLSGILAYVDDVIVVRLVLERLIQNYPDLMKPHQEDAPELFAPLPEQLQMTRECLQEGMQRIEQAAAQVSKLTFQGHSAAESITDEGGNWLYETVQEASVEALEFEEDEVHQATKQMDKVFAQLKLRKR